MNTLGNFLGYVLISPEKEDFVVGIFLDDGLTVVGYGEHPSMAKVFRDHQEIENFVRPLGDFTFDVSKLFDSGDQFLVEYETSVSSSPIN